MFKDEDVKKLFENIEPTNKKLANLIYKKEKSKLKTFTTNKKFVLIASIFILILATPFLLNINKKTEELQWNSIDYVSFDKMELSQAIMNVNESAESIYDDDLINNIKEYNIDENIDSIMLLNNSDETIYFSNNNSIIKQIVEMINVSYRQISLNSDEVENYIQLFTNGYTVTCSLNSKYSLNFIFLNTGEIVISDYGFCVSVTKINYNKFLGIVSIIKDEYGHFENDDNAMIDFENVDISNYNMNQIQGYDKLNYENLSTDSRKYYINFRVTINFEYTKDLLIHNNLYNKMYLPGTDIYFDSSKDFYKYILDNLGFDIFDNFEYQGTTISFDIGDLTLAKEKVLLKVFAFPKYIREISIKNNHYYESSENINYTKDIGYVNDKFLIIDSFEKLQELYILNEFYISDVTKLEKYRGDFFVDRFLYCISISGNRNYVENLEFEITQNHNLVTYKEIPTSSSYGDDILTIILFIEIDRIDGYSTYDYSINGKYIPSMLKTITFIHSKGELSLEFYTGEVVDIYTMMKMLGYQVIGFSYDKTFLEIFESFIVEEDMTLYTFTIYNETLSNSSTFNVFIINVTDPSKNTYVTFLKHDNFTKEIIEEKTGFNIDKTYANYRLSAEFNFNDKSSLAKYMYITEKDTSSKQRITYNYTVKSETFASKTNDYTNNLVTGTIGSLDKNKVYTTYDLLNRDYKALVSSNYDSYTFDDNTIALKIIRNAYNPSLINAEYELKNIVLDNENAIISLQRTYPEYIQSTDSGISCVDFIEINNLNNIIQQLKARKIVIAVDDTYIKTDFYANMDIKDIEIIEYDRDIFFNNYVYKQENEWKNITTEFENNQEKFIYKDGCYSGLTENNFNYGFLDEEQIDKQYFNNLFGREFDYDNNWIIIIDRYKNYSDLEIGSYEVSTSFNKISITGRYKLYGFKEEGITHYVDMVVVSKQRINFVVKDDIFEVSVNIANNCYGVRTCTFTENGNSYGVNNLLSTYKTDYKLYDMETAIVITEEPSIAGSLFNYMVKMLGYYPSSKHINGWSSNSPWFYIQRTATSSQVNVTYEFVGYDKETHVFTLLRTYNNINMTDNNNKTFICYDLVEVSGYSTGIQFPDVYNMPDDVSVVIIDK